jgi:hypothetical protein
MVTSGFGMRNNNVFILINAFFVFTLAKSSLSLFPVNHYKKIIISSVQLKKFGRLFVAVYATFFPFMPLPVFGLKRR